MKNTVTNIKKILCVLLSAVMIFSISAIGISAKTSFTDAWLTFDVWTGSGDVSVRIGDTPLTEELLAKVKPENFEKLSFEGSGFVIIAPEYGGYCTVEDDNGITVITLKEEFLKEFSEGPHMIYAHFKDAVVPLRLYIVTIKYVLPDANFEFDYWFGGESACLFIAPDALSVPVSADLFERLILGGEEVDSSCYSVHNSLGYTAIMLYADYLNTLPHGDHTFTAEFMNIDLTLKLDIVNSYNMWGDIDCDNQITAADARLCLRAAAKLEELNKNQAFAADVMGAGEITSASARKILRVAAGIDIFDTIKVEMNAGEEYVIGPLHTGGSGAYDWICDIEESGMEVSETTKTHINPNPGTSVDQIFTFTAKEAGTYHVNLRFACPWVEEPVVEYMITFIVK